MRIIALITALWVGPAIAQGADPSEFAGADIVVLGEVHDNPAHHLRQAEIVAALDPSAMVYEMLTPAQAARVPFDRLPDPNALGWDAGGWPDFAIYAPVFEAGLGRPVYGANIPRAAVRRAMGEPLGPLLAEMQGGAWDFGLDTPLPEDQQAEREAEQMEAHCDALPIEMLPGFVAAQRLRDGMLAGVALAALEAHGAPVVVITGNGHARTDWGVPALIARAAPGVDVRALGQMEGEMPDGPSPFDAVAVATPVDRGDPCEAFR